MGLSMYGVRLTMKAIRKKADQVQKVAAEKIQETASKTIEEFFEKAESHKDYRSEKDKEKARTNKYIRYLQSLLPSSLASQVPLEFYTDYGNRDLYRFPIKFPYYLFQVDGYDKMELMHNTYEIAGVQAPLKEEAIYALNFDKNVLVLHKRSDNKYGVAKWSDTKFTLFPTAKEAWKYADTIGYSGNHVFHKTNEIHEVY